MRYPLTAFLAAVCGSLLSPSHAGIPYNVDDPGTTEHGRTSVSLAYISSQASGTESQQTPNATLTYGLTNNTELDLLVGLASIRNTGTDRQYGCGDTQLGVRWRFLEETKNAPQVGLAYFLKVPTADRNHALGSGKYDQTGYAMAAKTFGRFLVMGNVGYSFVGGANDRDTIFYGAATTYQATEKVVLGAQLYGNTPSAFDGRNEVAYGIGLTDNFATDHCWMVQVGRSARGLSDLNVFAAYQVTFGQAIPAAPPAAAPPAAAAKS